MSAQGVISEQSATQNPQESEAPTPRSQVTMALVGLFSREHESTYRWLVTFLLNIRGVSDVRCVPITNSSQNFRAEAEKCDFAILYHTKKRGRVNVTNVVDSLYDEELRFLHDRFGKNNVLVVIDDLESSSEEEKARILSHQPSIGDFAQDLFIFSSADKDNLHGNGYQSSINALRALEDMKRIIKVAEKRHIFPGVTGSTGGGSSPAAQTMQTNRCCVIAVISAIALAVIILIIVLSTSTHHTVHLTTMAPKHANISNVTTAAYNTSSV